MSKEMVFFHSGEVVQLKQEIPNKPLMIVKRVVKSRINDEKGSIFLGVKCYWFTTTMELTEHLFNSKDLEKVC